MDFESSNLHNLNANEVPSPDAAASLSLDPSI